MKSSVFHGVLASQDELPSELQDKDFAHSTWALLNQSEKRIEPQCKNFIFCGGCKTQHLSQGETLEIKKRWLEEKLIHANLDHELIEIVESPKKTRYRNHVQVHINKHRHRGFYAPFSYRTVQFPEEGCLLFEQDLFDQDFPEGLELERCIRSRIDYVDNEINHWSLYSKEDKESRFTYTIEYPRGEKEIVTKVTIPNTAFFQINTSILPLWLDFIKSALSKYENQNLKVLELFSGFGFISTMVNASLSDQPFQTLGIDILPKKVLSEIQFESNDKEVARRLQTIHDRFKQSYEQLDLTILKDAKPKIREKIQSFNPDLMIVNPPRSGFLPEQIHFLLRFFKKPIVYSSCVASTFVRDLKILNSYGYQIKKLSLFDFFPFTAHYEVVGILEPNESMF